MRVKRTFAIASSPLNIIENDNKSIYIDYDCYEPNPSHGLDVQSRPLPRKPRTFTRCERRCASGLGRRQRVSQPNTTDTRREHLKNDWSGKWNQNRARQKPFRWLAFPFRTFSLVVTIYLVSYPIWYPAPTRVPCSFVHIILFLFFFQRKKGSCVSYFAESKRYFIYWFSIRVIQRWWIQNKIYAGMETPRDDYNNNNHIVAKIIMNRTNKIIMLAKIHVDHGNVKHISRPQRRKKKKALLKAFCQHYIFIWMFRAQTPPPHGPMPML